MLKAYGAPKVILEYGQVKLRVSNTLKSEGFSCPFELAHRAES